MSLLDFFKKREKRKRLRGVSKSALNRDFVQKPEAEDRKAEKTAELGRSGLAAVVLIKPKITEKSSILSEKGVYVFEGGKMATKPEIKRAVEDLYKVKVQKVNVLNVRSRERRVGRSRGHKPGYRKVLVKLSPGQKIEFI